MEGKDTDNLYCPQEVAEASKDRPPPEVINLTVEIEVSTDQVEDAPAQENKEPIQVHEPLQEINLSVGHQISGQHCIHLLGTIKKTTPYLL